MHNSAISTVVATVLLKLGGLSYIIPKKGGLSCISRTEKRGSIELSLPVHLLYGSTPPPGGQQPACSFCQGNQYLKPGVGGWQAP